MRNIVMILTLAGCGVESKDEAATWDAPAADQAESLRVAPVYGGCFDTTMYAANAGTTTAILFDLPGLVQATNNAGHRLHFTLPLPNPHVGIVYETGTNLTAGICGGAAPIHPPRVTQSYDIAGGTLDITSTPGPGGTATASLSLINPSFQQVGPGGGMGFAMAGTIDIPATTIGIWPP